MQASERYFKSKITLVKVVHIFQFTYCIFRNELSDTGNPFALDGYESYVDERLYGDHEVHRWLADLHGITDDDLLRDIAKRAGIPTIYSFGDEREITVHP